MSCFFKSVQNQSVKLMQDYFLARGSDFLESCSHYEVDRQPVLTPGSQAQNYSFKNIANRIVILPCCIVREYFSPIFLIMFFIFQTVSSCFKSSTSKSVRHLQFVPTNLHSQRMEVTCPGSTGTFRSSFYVVFCIV